MEFRGVRRSPARVTSLLRMPAASAVSDRVTLDVRGAILNCRQRTFGVSLPHPSRSLLALLLLRRAQRDESAESIEFPV